MQVRGGLETLGTATVPHAVPDDSWALFGSCHVPNTVLSALRESTQLTTLGSRCSDHSHLREETNETQQSSLSKSQSL